jgi:DNA-binding XRE family transcriptional regulator
MAREGWICAMDLQHQELHRQDSFGALLRRYRRTVGLTQEALSERAGISPRSLGDLARGAGHRPHPAHGGSGTAGPSRGLDIEMALASYGLSDAASTRVHGSEALVLAKRIGREDLEVAALGTLVFADSSDGEHQAGLDRYRQAATRVGVRYPDSVAPGMMMTSTMLYWLADFENAVALPDPEMRRRFQEAPPVRMVLHLARA